MSKTSKGQVLVVDYEMRIRQTLRTALESDGYRVEESPSGEDALVKCRTAKFDLILLELDLPGISGLVTCQELVRRTYARVIILTARGATKVNGLNAGALDYVTKPFGMRELLARIRAVLRRDPIPVPVFKPLKLDEVEINFESRRVIVGQKSFPLTPKEFLSSLVPSPFSQPNNPVPGVVTSRLGRGAFKRPKALEGFY